MKIEIISAYSDKTLNKKVNKFIKEHGEENIRDIQFNASFGTLSVMFVYD